MFRNVHHIHAFLIPTTITYFLLQTTNKAHGNIALHYALCLLFVCRPLWLLSSHTRPLHNQGAIPVKKGLERTGNKAAPYSVPLDMLQMLDVPYTIKDRHTTACVLQSVSQQERKWQRHLPCMLIKF